MEGFISCCQTAEDIIYYRANRAKQRPAERDGKNPDREGPEREGTKNGTEERTDETGRRGVSECVYLGIL